MALRGKAFLAIWHDIALEGEPDYNNWHKMQLMQILQILHSYLRIMT